MERGEDRKGLRTFGIGGGLILGLFALLFFLKGWTSAALCLACAGGLLLVPGLFFPQALGPIYRPWSRAARAVGVVQTRILLGAVYYAVFTPFSLVMRLVGKDLLDMKEARGAPSHWKERKDLPSPDHRRQF